VTIVAALAAMVRDPVLRPSYRNMFFTGHLSFIPIVLTPVGIGFILVHEWSHMLAARRLGLPSRLGIGRRLYYLVAETRLDSLLSVPRRRRYLPFLAGLLADAVVIAASTLLAAWLRALAAPAWTSGLCLAVAFITVLRFIWQFQLYLRTDLYYVAATILRCTDLQAATKSLIATRVRRLLRRPGRSADADDWSDRDRTAARWYAPLLIAGYGFALASLAWAGIPTLVRFFTAAGRQLYGPHTTPTGIVDALVLVALMAAQFGLLIYVTIRDRRANRRTRSQGVSP
jgi:hypothetical protein